METTDRVILGKKARTKGVNFESKVRKDLAKMGFMVIKFDNDVVDNQLVQAKKSFNPFTKRLGYSNGFPDFLAIRFIDEYHVIGVEAKKAKYLSPEEKKKCDWLLENKIVERILIASPSKVKRGTIYYGRYENK